MTAGGTQQSHCGTSTARFAEIAGDAMGNHLKSLKSKKWRRRESNPRPKPCGLGVYVRSYWISSPIEAR